MNRPVRVEILTEIPAPYRIPIFNALAERPGVELHVSFLAEQDPRRPYAFHANEVRFPYSFLPRVELRQGGRWTLLNGGVLARLGRERPDIVIVGGWNQPAYWQAFVACRLRRIPLVAWVESTARDFRPGTGPSEALKRAFVRGCSAFLVPGPASADYLGLLKVAAASVTVAPNAVDGRIFGERVASARQRRVQLRAELGLTLPCALYVGRLDPEKGLDVLLRAANGLHGEIVVVGSGTLDAALRAAAPQNVRFVGWVARDDLVPWYAAADVFVLPSLSEQWGLVLNEAAAAGLPLVATEAAGAAHSLVEPGRNGYRVPAGDPDALRAALELVLANAELREQLGRRSLEIAAAFTPAAWADAVEGLARRLTRAASRSAVVRLR